MKRSNLKTMFQWKRIICLFLAMIMIFTSVPTNNLVYADELSTESTEVATESTEVVTEQVEVLAETKAESTEETTEETTEVTEVVEVLAETKEVELEEESTLVGANNKITIYYLRNQDNLGWINAHVWNKSSGDAALTANGGWPGDVMVEGNDYYAWLKTDLPTSAKKIGFIAHNNSGGQTSDIVIDLNNFVYGENGYEVFVSGSDTFDKNAFETTVEGNSVTFNYRATSATTVKLMGFNGDWSNGIALEDPDGDNVYTHTMELEDGVYTYKYQIGSKWIADLGNTNPRTDKDHNSVLVVGDVLESPAIDGTSATFRFYAPWVNGFTSVKIAGSMNGWTGVEMTDEDGDDIYTYTYNDLVAGEHSYKFVLEGSKWIGDPQNTSTLDYYNPGGPNSLFTIVDEAAPEITSPELNDKNVTLRYYYKGEGPVYLRGDMTGENWPNLEMSADENTANVYYASMDLKPGKYEYQFYYVEGGTEYYMTDPNNQNHSENGQNSVVIVPGLLDGTATAVKGAQTTLPQLSLMDENGDTVKVDVSYALSGDPVEGIALNGNKLTVAEDCAAGSVTLIATYNEETAEVVVTLTDAEAAPVISPEVNGREVTFRYKGAATTVKLAGSMTDWANGALAMTKGNNNVYSKTLTLSPGKYTYKFIVDGNWIHDSLNDNRETDANDANSVLIVSGLIEKALENTKGDALTLPATLEYMSESGVTSNVAVTYTLADEDDADYATIADGTLTVSKSYTDDSIELIATAQSGATATITVTLYDKLYTYTIYVYSEDEERMSLEDSALYLWDKAGETTLAAADYDFTEKVELSDGRTWLKTEVKLGCSEQLGFIFKSKGSWSWQTVDLAYKNTAKQDCTLYIIDGQPRIFTSLDEVSTDYDRFIFVEYTNPSNLSAGANVYTWSNGYGDINVEFEEINGKYIAKIPVVNSKVDMTVGFIVNKSTGWNKDGGDNYVTIPSNQELVKVKFADGKITSTLPYNTGHSIDRANDKVYFYYRDDELLLEDNLASLNGKVELVMKSSTGNAALDGTHAMTYDEANERFTCNLALVDDTDYYYYYLIDGEKTLDAFNAKKGTLSEVEYSLVRNRSYELTLSASILNEEMDYNDHNIISVSWEAKEGEDLEGFAVEKLYLDLSQLGLGRKVEVDPALCEFAFGCDDAVAAGEKTIKVTLIDDCANEHTATATVTVTERIKTENTDEKLGDFDWDEAVIYFTVTDRFFDGNEDNNIVDGSTGYDPADETDGSRIHGGDFAGLTEKIDYLYDLGINTIWLTPIVDNIDQNLSDEDEEYEAYGYHGYWASSFTQLNPHLGDATELEALIDAAHAKGMKVMVDVVLNHAGYETEDYFNTIISDGNGGYINMVRGEEETVAGDDKLDSLSGLPDFITENEAVREQLVAWQTNWMKQFDIDYYRVDTVKHVDNTTWSAFKNALTESNPEFKLIGEYYGANYGSTAGQLDSGKMDSLLDFAFKDYARDLALGSLSGVEAVLATRNASLSNTATLGSFLSSHDEQGLLYTFMHDCNKEEDLATALMKVAATLQITAKGQPVIYYGEEIGQSGANNYPVQDNRYDFDWDALATMQTSESDNDIYDHYKKMLNIRRDYSELFAKGNRSVVKVSDAEGYDIVRRSYDGKNIYVAMNVWAVDKTASFEVTAAPGSVYTDLYSGDTYTVAENGTLTITIPKANDGGTAVLIITEGEESAIEDTNEVTLKLHYKRTDGKYTGWQAYMWTDNVGGKHYPFEEENGEMVATITVDGREETNIKYVINKDEWALKDVNADQEIDISDVVSGTVHFYVNAGVAGGTRLLGIDAIKGSKIVSSLYDRATNTVKVVTSAPVAGNVESAFVITRTDGVDIPVTKVTVDDCTYTLTLGTNISDMLETLKSYILTYDGYEYGLGMPNLYSSEEFENQYTYTGKDLGANWTSTATTFKVWTPTADHVQVALYESGTEGTEDLIKKLDMVKGEKGVWSVTENGNLHGTYYTYLVDVNGEIAEACDPYARTTGVNGKRAMIINLDSTDPEGWAMDVSPNQGLDYTDAVIYELHVRDASIDESSGVSAANKGKFLGLTETGTKTSGGVSTALDHIKDLGATHVHLLPVYDYGSVDESRLDEPQFNWGYDPVNYNVPEGSYSTDPYNGATRVKEMKEMVMALHENGINVIMDVVYNHVYDASSFSFNKVVPKYFSRTFADGRYTNGSGCGNDTASERTMVRKYIVDSVMYWAEEYHIDGFRFDLVGLLDTQTMNEIIDTVHAKYPDVIFYGEGWEMAQGVTKDNTSMATKYNAYLTPGLAYFSDDIRNLLAGDTSATNVGFASGLTGREETLAECFKGASSWCMAPTQTINYASCHDNYTLKDKLNITRSDATEADRIKMNNLTAAIYMMAEGIPLIHAGEEFLRTKIDEDGEVIHNSYNASDYVNKLRWSNLENETYADVADYYKGLIEFRKNHAALRLTTKAEVSANVDYKKVSSNVVLFNIDGRDSVAEEVSDGIVVIFNSTNAAKSFSLYSYGVEAGEWKVCINGEDSGIEVLDTITDGNVTVAPISAMVLVKGETEDTDSVYDHVTDVKPEPKPDPVVEVTSIKLNKTTLALEAGKTAVLTATVAPTNATNKAVTWTTSNAKVATVSNGTVKAVGNGNAVITATTANGKKATCTVTVSTAVSGVKLNKTTAVITKGTKLTLKATVTPTTASNKKVTWTSSNKKVATVDANGKVTGKAAGTAVITAKTANGKTAKCTITVATITLNAKSVPVQVGKSTKAVKITKTYAKDKVVSWKSSNTKVATVSKAGKITGKKAGSAKITVTMKSGATATIKVTVQKKAVVTKGLKLSSKKLTMKVKGKETLTVTRNPISATEKLTWTSSDTKIATVKNGKITAKKAGKVTITVKSANGKKATCKVTIKK